LLNFLLAIIVEAYMQAHESSRESGVTQNVLVDLLSVVVYRCARVVHRWPSNRCLLRELSKRDRGLVACPELYHTGLFRDQRACAKWIVYFVKCYPFLKGKDGELLDTMAASVYGQVVGKAQKPKLFIKAPKIPGSAPPTDAGNPLQVAPDPQPTPGPAAAQPTSGNNNFNRPPPSATSSFSRPLSSRDTNPTPLSPRRESSILVSFDHADPQKCLRQANRLLMGVVDAMDHFDRKMKARGQDTHGREAQAMTAHLRCIQSQVASLQAVVELQHPVHVVDLLEVQAAEVDWQG
jgi:hypothetical protein